MKISVDLDEKDVCVLKYIMKRYGADDFETALEFCIGLYYNTSIEFLKDYALEKFVKRGVL